jgi:hypothetical protein
VQAYGTRQMESVPSNGVPSYSSPGVAPRLDVDRYVQITGNLDDANGAQEHAERGWADMTGSGVFAAKAKARRSRRAFAKDSIASGYYSGRRQISSLPTMGVPSHR